MKEAVFSGAGRSDPWRANAILVPACGRTFAAEPAIQIKLAASAAELILRRSARVKSRVGLSAAESSGRQSNLPAREARALLIFRSAPPLTSPIHRDISMASEPSRPRTTSESLRHLLYRLQDVAVWNDDFKVWELDVCLYPGVALMEPAAAKEIYQETLRRIDQVCEQLSMLAESRGINCSPLARLRRDLDPKNIPEVEELLLRLHAIERVVSGDHVPEDQRPPFLTGPPSWNDSQNAGPATDKAIANGPVLEDGRLGETASAGATGCPGEVAAADAARENISTDSPPADAIRPTRATKEKWWHEADETPPSKYQFGPLIGTGEELASAVDYGRDRKQDRSKRLGTTC